MRRQMRIISMSLTARQFIAGTKDVTRRVGWKHAKVGMRLRVVEKAMGLQKGERMRTLGFIELTNVRSEPLSLMLNGAGGYGPIECAREGFPKWTPQEFVTFFCETHAVKPHAHVTRLEYRKIDIDDGVGHAQATRDDLVTLADLGSDCSGSLDAARCDAASGSKDRCADNAGATEQDVSRRTAET